MPLTDKHPLDMTDGGAGGPRRTRRGGPEGPIGDAGFHPVRPTHRRFRRPGLHPGPVAVVGGGIERRTADRGRRTAARTGSARVGGPRRRVRPPPRRPPRRPRGPRRSPAISKAWRTARRSARPPATPAAPKPRRSPRPTPPPDRPHGERRASTRCAFFVFFAGNGTARARRLVIKDFRYVPQYAAAPIGPSSQQAHFPRGLTRPVRGNVASIPSCDTIHGASNSPRPTSNAPGGNRSAATTAASARGSFPYHIIKPAHDSHPGSPAAASSAIARATVTWNRRGSGSTLTTAHTARSPAASGSVWRSACAGPAHERPRRRR